MPNRLDEHPGDRFRGRAPEGVAAILREDLPVIPIAWYQHTSAVSPAIENITIDPFERANHSKAAGYESE
jgi:hypothetical protein